MKSYKSLKVLLIFTTSLLYGCMPAIHPSGAKTYQGEIQAEQFITADEVKLPLRQWLSMNGKTDAVIIALHGFNDYSHFFQRPAEYFQQHNIASYAYDLRGFGKTQQRGLWAGYQTYSEDLALFTRLIAEKHPNTPIYLLGESMGAAVIVVAMSEVNMPEVTGIILAAPAVWARDFMPWYQTSLLSLLSHTMPWLTLTGESVGVVASDNIEWLRKLGRDPLVIKETRVEAVHGLTDLMDKAMENSKNLHVKTLLMYGEKDELIPAEPTSQFIHNFLQQETEQKKIACYKNGYHLLLHDLQAQIVWQDLQSWILTAQPSLPSGAEQQKTCFKQEINSQKKLF
jgi:alpha-beta hydrolase superfamily lysophospholipase